MHVEDGIYAHGYSHAHDHGRARVRKRPVNMHAHGWPVGCHAHWLRQDPRAWPKYRWLHGWAIPGHDFAWGSMSHEQF
eukprot:360395-Chlamydomonas_euryale.AAC.4